MVRQSNSGRVDNETLRYLHSKSVSFLAYYFTLRADLPGMTEADVSIEVRDNTLTLSGERQAEHEDRQRGYYRLERQSGKFSRALSLPEGVNADAIEANFAHGVLEVRIPKPEERKPRRIEIKATDGNGKPTLEGSATER
jgi:HSP20 family protein